ncbi:MAG: methionyl-tRNA formyltransferase [Sulfurifustaceae bacterium]
MKIVFAGTPAFALPTLERLHQAGHDILAVYTQPDRPAGRGRKLRASPIKEYALAHGLLVHQPATLRGEEPALAALGADAMVVVAYGLLLPSSILSVPRLGCINVHASLLPRWRGAAPIARAIEAGDDETGITIMQMEKGLDTGPILAQTPTPILETDTTESLEQRLAELGAETLLSTLARLVAGEITPRAQDAAHACYAPKLRKEEAPLEWNEPAVRLHRKIRALNPWPIATTVWRGQVLRIWEAATPIAIASDDAAAGTVLTAGPHGLRVQTGDGTLDILRLQAPGGRTLSVREFLNGTPIAAGDRFER